MYADGADQPFHSLPDLIGDKYVLGINWPTEMVLKGWSPDTVFNFIFFKVYVCVYKECKEYLFFKKKKK